MRPLRLHALCLALAGLMPALSAVISALANLPVIASFRSDNVEGFVRLLEATACLLYTSDAADE